ncbi:MAG: DUF1801 domain-containing protein [Proteobacteria bacterium]|nr:DUF1801 domain-containing protein [Pseudomonadota bacterium]
MVQNKTRATDASVDAYLAARAKGQQADDSRALIALFERITGQPAKMWGPSIVGHGSYRYTYDSGRSGDMPLAGFAIRGRELVVYLDCEHAAGTLLPKLGKHRMGKSCLYFRQLSDLDITVLERLVTESVAHVQRTRG